MNEEVLAHGVSCAVVKKKDQNHICIIHFLNINSRFHSK